MNGRVYDPTISRFLSVDSHIPYIYESQSFNRYSYTRNNPLKYVDPSGYKDFSAVDVYADDKPDLSDLYGGGNGDDYLQDKNGNYLTKAISYNETFYNGMNHVNVTVVPIEIHIEPIDMNSILEKIKLKLAKNRDKINEQEEKAQRERRYLYERYGVHVEGALAATIPGPFGKEKAVKAMTPKPTLSQLKKALKEVHKKVGKQKKRDPEKKGKFGSLWREIRKKVID